MKILFVAPSSNLVVASEIFRIASGHQVDFCVDSVDRSKLELSLRKTSYDVVHFAQHGTRLLLELSDGPLEVRELVAMLRNNQRHLYFIFLNSCDSVSTGVELHNYLTIPTIVHSASIDDLAAVRFAEAVYRNLGAGLDLDHSVETAKATLSRLYPMCSSTPQLVNGSRATIDMLSVKLDECTLGMRTDLTDLRANLSEAFEHFNREIAELDKVLETIRQSRHRHIELLIVLLLVALLLAQVATPVLNVMLHH